VSFEQRKKESNLSIHKESSKKEKSWGSLGQGFPNLALQIPLRTRSGAKEKREKGDGWRKA
jgi:hypothetical protein